MEQAQAALVKKVGVELGPPPEPPRTLRSYISETYLPLMGRKNENYLRQIDWATKRMGPLLDLPLEELTRIQIRAFLTRQESEIPQSVMNLFRVLRAIVNQMVSDYDMDRNPMPPKWKGGKPVRRGEVLTLEELARLVSGEPSWPHSVAVLGAIYGLGYNEMRMYVVMCGSIVIAESKNEHRSRLLPASPQHHDVFCQCALPYSDSSLNKGLNAYALKMGVTKRLNRNVLRHTCATNLYELGCPKEIVDSILGHAPQGTSLKVYNHSDHMDLKRLWLGKYVEAIEQAMERISKEETAI